jgi:hypothetical protein
MGSTYGTELSRYFTIKSGLKRRNTIFFSKQLLAFFHEYNILMNANKKTPKTP